MQDRLKFKYENDVRKTPLLTVLHYGRVMSVSYTCTRFQQFFVMGGGILFYSGNDVQVLYSAHYLFVLRV
jgi:hypothetical protein